MATYKYLNNKRILMTAQEEDDFKAMQKEYADNLFDVEMQSLRGKRNRLLLECDWIELNNSPLSEEKKNEWREYRVKLRDITNGLTTVKKIVKVVFPDKPE